MLTEDARKWIVETLDLRVWEIACLIHEDESIKFSYVRWKELRNVMRITSFPTFNFSRNGTSGSTSPEPIWIDRPPLYRTDEQWSKPIPLSVGKITVHTETK